MAHILSIDSALYEEQKTVQDALEELNAQLILYENLENGPEHAEDERHQASKVMEALQKLTRLRMADGKEREMQVHKLLKELVLVTGSHEDLRLEQQVMTPVEEAWKTALDELNKQLVLYDRLGHAPEQVSERTSEEEGEQEEEERDAKVVAAMYKVSDVHTDPKVKEAYRK
ncbi:hypothetical protein C0993_011828 [Termitomyces sp. T159_Od127]|nr:hypothetical protein C0993_011828 [Termitomyces sp. T159_Od127]